MQIGQDWQRQRPAFGQGQRHQQTEADNDSQTEQGKLEAADGRTGRWHAAQGEEHGAEEQAGRHDKQQRPALQCPGLAEPETADQQHSAAGQSDVHGPSQHQRAGQVGAGHHGQNLDHGSQHDLQHEADGEQMGSCQGAGCPPRGKDCRPFDRHQQASQHGKQRRRQEKAQGSRKRRCVIEGKHSWLGARPTVQAVSAGDQNLERTVG